MATKLRQSLDDAGFQREVEEFWCIVLQVKQGLFPDWTDAIRYCKAVNEEAGCEIPEHITLRTLINCRKRSLTVDDFRRKGN